jgi:hypothetical protein
MHYGGRPDSISVIRKLELQNRNLVEVFYRPVTWASDAADRKLIGTTGPVTRMRKPHAITANQITPRADTPSRVEKKRGEVRVSLAGRSMHTPQSLDAIPGGDALGRIELRPERSNEPEMDYHFLSRSDFGRWEDRINYKRQLGL